MRKKVHTASKGCLLEFFRFNLTLLTQQKYLFDTIIQIQKKKMLYLRNTQKTKLWMEFTFVLIKIFRLQYVHWYFWKYWIGQLPRIEHIRSQSKLVYYFDFDLNVHRLLNLLHASKKPLHKHFKNCNSFKM